MMKKNTLPKIACHHGDYHHQNNLKYGEKILKKYDNEIDLMEIDFIFYEPCNNFVSSHDYTTNSILRGSFIKDWIELVIHRYKKILWIDLKPHLDIMSLISLQNHYPYEAYIFFNVLNEIRAHYLRHHNGFDIKEYILITSQDMSFKDELLMINTYKWDIIMDIPYLPHYLWQSILPNDTQYILNNYVYNYFSSYDFSQCSFISIDLTFFNNNVDKVKHFIKNNRTIREDKTFIILYNFQRYTKPIHMHNYRIITMYDYHS